jgi:hypothetical protein
MELHGRKKTISGDDLMAFRVIVMILNPGNAT